MKLGIRYTLTGQAPVEVLAGPRAISAAEKNYGIKVATDGLSLEQLGFAAWAQATNDGLEPGPWKAWWEQVDDLDVIPAPDPTGRATDPSPDSSSGSPSAPASPTST